MYSLFRLLLEALGDRETVVKVLARKGGHAHFLPPFNWVLPERWRWPLGDVFVYRCERGVLQYVVIRVVLAVAALVAELRGVLCEGWSEAAHCAAPWVNSAIMISQSVAMYSLVMYYHELTMELKKIRALQKLLAVKAVVFMSFVRFAGGKRFRASRHAPHAHTPPPPPPPPSPSPPPPLILPLSLPFLQFQGIVLGGLFYANVLSATQTFTETDLAASLQNFLICLEMALAAACHHFVFSRREFKSGALPAIPGGGRLPVAAAFLSVLPADVVREAGAAGTEVAENIRKTVAAAAGSSAEAAAAPAGGAAAGSGDGDPWRARGSAGAAAVGLGTPLSSGDAKSSREGGAVPP